MYFKEKKKKKINETENYTKEKKIKSTTIDKKKRRPNTEIRKRKCIASSFLGVSLQMISLKAI